MKEDMSKVRFKRTGIRKAELEMMLFSCAFNVRKLFSFISGNTNALVKYELPEDTPGEEFPKVKPSKKKTDSEITRIIPEIRKNGKQKGCQN